MKINPYPIMKAVPAPLRNALRRLYRRLSPEQISGAFEPMDSGRALESLDPQFRAVLDSMYRGRPQLGADGQLHHLRGNSMTIPANGAWLYGFCRELQPEATLEIGLGYGFSTMFIMAALYANGTGHHTAIDPFQFATFNGIGEVRARGAMALGVDFDFIDQRSDRACIDLARSSRMFDLIFIDGGHKFDDVLVDFTLCAPLCRIGGYIILDDTWMGSIRSVVSFIRRNREDFREVSGGPSTWCVLEKVGEDRRKWRHFRKFRVAGTDR